MDELEERIVSFVIRETGIEPKRVSLSSSLAQDLGIDGDDASEFFEKFGSEFNLDLADLVTKWNLHFRGEMSGLPTGFLFTIPIALVLGELLHDAFMPVPSWGWMIVLMLILGWIHYRFFGDHDDGKFVITVSDLVDAARAEKWVMPYDSRRGNSVSGEPEDAAALPHRPSFVE